MLSSSSKSQRAQILERMVSAVTVTTSFRMSSMYRSDVIALLIFMRDNPGDPGADFNSDANVDITDAIALLLAMRDGTCPDASILLSAAGEEQPVTRIEGLTEEEIAYLEQIMSQLDLTAEEEAAFRLALYGVVKKTLLPKAFSLSQNYPNPFNPSTTISYSIEKPGKVKLIVYDILGKKINTLVNRIQKAGAYRIDFNGSSLPSGIYFYRLSINGIGIETKRMLLIK